ncbi:alpha/beta hydrolase [Brachybacterium sp. AOP3-A1-3]|uniref:alpha/beta hydrolase n=1 Tax=Brachybacterium sp. AOP3-A1-3 TaxID=3457699 RepID=UPI004033D9F5
MTVVVVKPWLHLSLFDRRGLDTFTADLPEVGTWIVGGHSLGGVRACQVAPDADALLLLGSYCANDLSERELPVLSLAGSEDRLSTPEKIADARYLLPETATMVEIEGAGHASFGDYGPQDGDGTASISDEEMDTEVSAEVEAFVDSFG